MIPENGKTYWAQELPAGAVQIVYVADGAAWTIGNSTRHPIPAFEYLEELEPYEADVKLDTSTRDITTLQDDGTVTFQPGPLDPPMPLERVLPDGAGPAVVVDSGGVGGGVNPDTVL